MALSQVSTGATYDNGGSSWSSTNLTKDTGTASGDLAIIAVSHYENGAADFNDPTGFTLRGEIAVQGTPDSGTASVISIWTRACDGTEGASYTVGVPGGTIIGTAMLLTLRGTSALTHASTTAGTEGSGTSAVAPSVSGTNGQGLIALYGLSDPGGTYTPPSGMTLGIAPGTDLTNTGRIYYETLSATQATGTRTLAFTTTRDANGVSMLVDGAAAGGGNVTLTVDTAGAITVAGQTVTFARALAVSAGAISIAGSDVTLDASGDTTLSVTAGAITVAGQSIAANRTGVLSAGAIDVAGQSVGLNFSAALTGGAITVSGQDHWFEYAVPWDAGVITIVGQSSTMNLREALSPGALTISGQDVALNAGENITLPVTAGAISIEGQSVALNRFSALSAGALTVAGQSAGLNLTAVVSPGAVTLAGQDIALSGSGTTTLPVTAGSITIAGQSLALQISAPMAAGAISVAGQSITTALQAALTAGAITVNGQVVTLSDSGAVPPEPSSAQTVTVHGPMSVTIHA